MFSARASLIPLGYQNNNKRSRLFSTRPTVGRRSGADKAIRNRLFSRDSPPRQQSAATQEAEESRVCCAEIISTHARKRGVEYFHARRCIMWLSALCTLFQTHPSGYSRIVYIYQEPKFSYVIAILP
jgi:hypothetical protein